MNIEHIKIVSNNTKEYKFVFHKNDSLLESSTIDPSVSTYSSVNYLQIKETAYKLKYLISELLLSIEGEDFDNFQKNIESLRIKTFKLFFLVFLGEYPHVVCPQLGFELEEPILIGDINPTICNSRISLFCDISSCSLKNESIYSKVFNFQIN